MFAPDPRLEATKRYKRLATIGACSKPTCPCTAARRRHEGTVHCPSCDQPAPSLAIAVRGDQLSIRCEDGCDPSAVESAADRDDVLTSRYGLLPQHARLLRDSVVAPAVASASRYQSVEVRARFRRLGFSEAQSNAPGLLVPIYDAVGSLAIYQYRPDTPRIGENGKPIKYETPRGSRMVLDVPNAVRARIGDPDVPLYITEGARKADAAASEGLSSVALLGVWNWRGTNDQGGKVALPDWENVALNGRDVYIVFDSDVMTKPQVYGALTRLKPFLESRGARIRIVYLPPDPSGAKVGLDDFLAAGHDESDLLRYASDVLRPAPGDDERDRLPYRATEGGLVWTRPTQNGSVDTPLTNFTARIVADVAEDDGAEVRRVFEMEGCLGGRTVHFDVAADRFASMNWATEHLGAGALVYPGFGIKDYARAAIQLLSAPIPARRVYASTGWHKIDGTWAYLHANGALGPDGPLPDVDVRLPGVLSRYSLPSVPHSNRLVESVRASLRLIRVAPRRITVPLLGATYRAVLGVSTFSIHLTGASGYGKTELASLAQRHFGPGMDANNLPGAWLSTANSLADLQFQVKDGVLVVDDYVTTSAADRQRLERDADRLFRGQGNSAGRQRMRSDGTLRPPRAPRGTLISTGDDTPRGQSLRARILIDEVGPKDVDWQRLTECQRDAADGRYAESLVGFVGWLAPRHEQTLATMRDDIVALRWHAAQQG